MDTNLIIEQLVILNIMFSSYLINLYCRYLYITSITISKNKIELDTLTTIGLDGINVMDVASLALRL